MTTENLDYIKYPKILANRVYFATQLINIYDICNETEPLTPKSKEFLDKKKQIKDLQDKIALAHQSDDEKAFEAGMDAEETLQKMNVLDEEGNLKSDEILIAQFNEESEQRRREKISKVLNPIDSFGLTKEFATYLGNNNILDLKKSVIDCPTRGEAAKIREQLALDFAVFQETQPNHRFMEHKESIIKQTESVKGKYYYAEENPARNAEIRKDFNTNDNAKKKFLKFMGNLLGLGERMAQSPSLSCEDYYAEIRKLSGNDNLTVDYIRKAAEKSYNSFCQGVWLYKNKVNYDPRCNKNDYVKRNISKYITYLKLGRNDLLSLALLSPADEKEYQSASEERKEEIEKQHISIHHKIPEKYHNLFKNPEDQFLLNDISNFEMVVGGALHKDMHKDDVKNIIKIMPVKNSAVLCVPGSEKIDPKKKVEIPFDIKEPEKLTELRPQKSQKDPTDRGPSAVNVVLNSKVTKESRAA